MGRTERQPHIVRLFALTLVFLLVMGAVPIRASALTGSTGGLDWSLSAGTLTISGSGAMPDYTDANMAPWYDSASAINRIVVKEGVASIGSLAFYGCSAAQRAALPSTVTAIGDRAFKNCTSLTWVSLPEGLESIGEAAFESCSSLNGIILPESLRSIGSYAFERCTSLSSIVIPSGVTRLGMVVFYHCTSLARVEILCPIEKIPDWFFYGCTSLAEVYIPKTVTETGDESFHDCNNLSTVYYSGVATEGIVNAIHSDTDNYYTEVVNNSESSESSSSESTSSENSSNGIVSTGSNTTTSTTMDQETGNTTTITVTQTQEAIITETTKTDYTFTVNGEGATFSEALEASCTDESEVDISKETATSITATVSGSTGWEDVAATTKDAAVHRSDSSGVNVTVQLTGNTVDGSDLAEMAGVDAQVTMATPEGCTWAIDMSTHRSTDLSGNDLDLSFTVELQESNVKGIESDMVYQVGFASNVSFDAEVGIPLKVANARQAATLYEKNGSKMTELTSVVVDETGCAWFPVNNIDSKKDYYVSINDKNADTADAILPDSMLENYGVDYVQTLTDASGKQYEIGERESRWGITGKQFTIYVVIVIAAVVFIVTGVMITLNRINRSKAKYATMAEDDSDEDYDIDEDELRLQVMQEMLEEARREKEGK